MILKNLKLNKIIILLLLILFIHLYNDSYIEVNSTSRVYSQIMAQSQVLKFPHPSQVNYASHQDNRQLSFSIKYANETRALINFTLLYLYNDICN